jgi:SAM-dependent methyltransferase
MPELADGCDKLQVPVPDTRLEDRRHGDWRKFIEPDMKIRDSGMPESGTWEQFFEPDAILDQLQLTSSCNSVVEFGCGYGTFTIPAARRVSGEVHALDIDASMLAVASRRAQSCQLKNIRFTIRDFIAEGTGLPTASVDYAMLFNILHHEDPVELLREAYRTLKHGGLLGIIHWNHDSETPRGPPLNIRPRPEQCRQWAEAAGFVNCSDEIDLPPYHYGLVLRQG